MIKRITEKTKKIFLKIKTFIFSIPSIYIFIPFIIIAFLVDPLFGITLVFLGYLMPITFLFYQTSLNNIIIYYVILIFFSVTLPGDKKIEYKNIRDVNITNIGDEFYVKYKDNNNYKIESFHHIPICKNYQLADKIVNYNYFGYKYNLEFDNKLKCKD